MSKEKTALFIDGSNFYAAARALNMDIDYAKLHSFFSADVNLIRAYYYTALPEDQEFSSLRPLIDWLDYNGFAVVSKLTREFSDPETGKRRIKGNMDMELALDMLKLAPHIDHAILFSGDGDFCRLLRMCKAWVCACHCLNDKSSRQWWQTLSAHGRYIYRDGHDPRSDRAPTKTSEGTAQLNKIKIKFCLRLKAFGCAKFGFITSPISFFAACRLSCFYGP